MPTRSRCRVAVLGSTGSIGCNALKVLDDLSDRFEIAALSAHHRLAELVDQARQYSPATIVATDAELAASYPWPSDLPCQRNIGHQALEDLAARDDIDIVVAAIVGSAGLPSTLAAIRSGKRVALANKETMVVAGQIAVDLAQQSGAEILPVDSEHGAIYQAIKAGQRSDVRRVILTASGGPFRQLSAQQMSQVSVDQALAHPTWEMGRKITIDSATMMNKALEIIEARWLFDLPPEKIDIVVHPQSIVHSMVEFEDGSVVAQLSPPDMKLPIQYALTYPDRPSGLAERMDWSQKNRLEFEPPDHERFPALQLGLEVARLGGTSGAVLNAANEVAVQSFLDRKIAFPQIVAGCRAVLDQHHFEAQPNLETLQQMDRWARQEMEQWILA